MSMELRRRHENFPISTGESYDFGQPNSLVHIDITLDGIKNIVKEVYGQRGNEILNSRVRCVTARVWKPLKGPVMDWPLALCESKSLEDADIVPADAVYERVVAEYCMVHHNPAQSWYYLREQKPTEALIFKATDSNAESISRCAHGSFYLPETKNTIPRESIDVRVLVMDADIDYPTEVEWFT
ncbi:hypothetical protein BOTNAR_0359g00140 [Botryotinia narcissicola]|uniref:Uncharacterized protein n=1 Tax=Botryotinia narcissicola TaxID=278944 RepID=A0A4Z1HR87_9HELO|nr:hypothetical protein BOTNAR_0359g00140 [Botryotinia narcissicola]